MAETKEKEFPRKRILSAGKFTEIYKEGCINGQRYCFILGSGASVESGIPMGGTLEYRWMNCLMGEESDRETPAKDRGETLECAENLSDELQYDFNEVVEEWKKARKAGRNTLPSEYYFDIYKLRFYGDELNGDRYLENIMESAEPSFGYHTLAQLLTDEYNNNLVITTNFDSLAEDALFLYTGKKPLIINHEFEAGFIRDQSIRRPIIAKLHRGLFFKPFNNPADTTGLSGDWEDILRQIFYRYIPVVIGYGGGDRSFMEFLLREQNLIPKIYWCYVNRYGLPDERIRDLIRKKNEGFFVRTDGFDHIMLTMGGKMFFSKISTNATETYLRKRTEERISRYNEQYQKLSEAKADSKELKSEVKEFSKNEEKDREERKKNTSLTEWDYIREGNACFNNKEYEKALEAYKRAAGINSSQAGAYLGCGNAHQRMGEYEKALEAYAKALELDPEHVNAYNGRGNAYKALGEYEKAVSDYDRALELDPESVYVYNGRGNTYQALGEYEKAVSDYDKAIGLDPEYVIGYYNRGNAYQAVGKYEEALADYSKALELDPKYEYAYNNRGNTYDSMGDYEKAIADYTQAIQINPGEALYYQNRAKTYRKLGDAEKAEADEQKAKEIKELEQK
ncbi:tetratricopeptide repeat protein [Lachnoclostridium sp. An76]|uniref:tetratricopeptide repeat protein n=1 Tax=Lachnoclostridium sp. An76 TaxID=1965654 RepID=UPI000B38B7CE|nr:tetratricopeptide repeat protein [Lachnoclostridium sp. An76]OUN32993.1 hypothetical protein B5G27_14290 [Lachnoclostridium sp. An76]